MKICRECGRELPLSEFYTHSEMLDGHLNKCKECVKKRVSRHRENHIDEIRKYDRERGKTEKRQLMRSKITRRRRHSVDGYQKSHNAIIRAIAGGKLIRSNTCQVCGKQCKTEAHHFDYHLSLKVIWLCAACHRQYHTGKTARAEHIRKVINLMIDIKKNVV